LYPTDRQTDRPHYICKNRSHHMLRITMRLDIISVQIPVSVNVNSTAAHIQLGRHTSISIGITQSHAGAVPCHAERGGLSVSRPLQPGSIRTRNRRLGHGQLCSTDSRDWAGSPISLLSLSLSQSHSFVGYVLLWLIAALAADAGTRHVD